MTPRERILERIKEIHPDRNNGVSPDAFLLRRLVQSLKKPRCKKPGCDNIVLKKGAEYCSLACGIYGKMVNRMAKPALTAACVVFLVGCRTPDPTSVIALPKTSPRPVPALKAAVPVPPAEPAYRDIPITYPIPVESVWFWDVLVDYGDGQGYRKTWDWILDGNNLIVSPTNAMALYRIAAWPRE